MSMPSAASKVQELVHTIYCGTYIHSGATKFPNYLCNAYDYVQGPPDMNADFRVMDVQDGTVCFDSVTSPGTFIGITVANGQQTNLNIMMLVRIILV